MLPVLLITVVLVVLCYSKPLYVNVTGPWSELERRPRIRRSCGVGRGKEKDRFLGSLTHKLYWDPFFPSQSLALGMEFDYLLVTHVASSDWVSAARQLMGLVQGCLLLRIRFWVPRRDLLLCP